MRRPCLQLAIESLESREDAPHPQNRIAPFRRAASMGSAAACFNRGPREPLVRDTDLQVGGLGNNRAISRPFTNECIRTDARVLLINDCCHDQSSLLES